MATNKDIIQKLECVETKLMSGELEEIHQTVKEIKEIFRGSMLVTDQTDLNKYKVYGN